MSPGVNFWISSIGLKALMAVTGLVLILFLMGHLAGNLQVLTGTPGLMNEYAQFLREGTHGMVWLIRATLLLLFVIHVVVAITLWFRNRRARPERYAVDAVVQAGFSTRTMIWTGLIVLVFVVYHLLHFTFGKTHPEIYHLVDPEHGIDVYSMVVLGFRNAPVAIVYIAAMVVLGFHLRHAIFAFLQTLGLSNPRYERMVRTVAPVLAVVIAVGYVLIPVAVLLGAVGLPEGVTARAGPH